MSNLIEAATLTANVYITFGSRSTAMVFLPPSPNLQCCNDKWEAGRRRHRPDKVLEMQISVDPVPSFSNIPSALQLYEVNFLNVAFFIRTDFVKHIGFCNVAFAATLIPTKNFSDFVLSMVRNLTITKVFLTNQSRFLDLTRVLLVC